MKMKHAVVAVVLLWPGLSAYGQSKNEDREMVTVKFASGKTKEVDPGVPAFHEPGKKIGERIDVGHGFSPGLQPALERFRPGELVAIQSGKNEFIVVEVIKNPNYARPSYPGEELYGIRATASGSGYGVTFSEEYAKEFRSRVNARMGVLREELSGTGLVEFAERRRAQKGWLARLFGMFTE